MNEELRKAAQEVLAASEQSEEFQRRMLKLLELATTSTYTDSDARQVIELTDVGQEE